MRVKIVAYQITTYKMQDTSQSFWLRKVKAYGQNLYPSPS